MFTTFQVAKALNIKYPRLREWIDKEYVRPSGHRAAGQGDKTLFTKSDVYLLRLFVYLVERGFSREEAAFRTTVLSDIRVTGRKQIMKATYFFSCRSAERVGGEQELLLAMTRATQKGRLNRLDDDGAEGEVLKEGSVMRIRAEPTSKLEGAEGQSGARPPFKVMLGLVFGREFSVNLLDPDSPDAGFDDCVIVNFEKIRASVDEGLASLE